MKHILLLWKYYRNKNVILTDYLDFNYRNEVKICKLLPKEIYNDYRVINGSIISLVAYYPTAKHYLDAMDIAIDEVSDRLMINKSVHDYSINNTYIDDWLVDDAGYSIHPADFHRSYQTTIVKLIKAIRHLKETDDESYKYYSRVYAKLFQQSRQWTYKGFICQVKRGVIITSRRRK